MLEGTHHGDVPPKAVVRSKRVECLFLRFIPQRFKHNLDEEPEFFSIAHVASVLA